MTHHLIKVADRHRATFHERMGDLATRRLQKALTEFRRRFPNRALSMRFGNGAEFIDIDDTWSFDVTMGTVQKYDLNDGWPGWVGRPYKAPTLAKIIGQAVRDVWTITNGYREGCPDDIKFAPTSK